MAKGLTKRSALNICIAVAKEKALGEMQKNRIAKVVCPKM